MSMYERTNKLAGILRQIAEDLDIPESKYLDAKNRYETVGDWLRKEGSKLAIFSPWIYPQGSFSLGTVTKPVSNKDEYDIDLVCYLAELEKQNTSQAALKRMVGERLAENETYKRLLGPESRKCWRLNYADEFHMDILPAIPDKDLQRQGGIYSQSILITDKKKIEKNDVDWPKSNPKGYVQWFVSRQSTIFLARKRELAEALNAKMDDIPDYKVKTPLQRAIQILKRHRDIFCLRKKNADCRPISIIITTLAATIYQGQDNVYSAIHDILNGINENAVKKDGKFYIPNPANPGENFADKWNENPALPALFFEWVKAAQETFCIEVLNDKRGLEVGAILEENLGIKIKDEKAQSVSVAPTYTSVNTSSSRRPWGNA